MPVQMQVQPLGHRVAPATVVKFNDLVQVFKFPRVHIGWRLYYVAHCRHFETRLQFGRIVSSFRANIQRPSIGFRGANNSHLLIRKQGWGMALRTARDK